ncbi:MAG: DUF308 domain-containing protein [Pseudanabaena sp.]|nr:MAG: DUF308 domain-containing protein [Pseudanabaena sp.]
MFNLDPETRRELHQSYKAAISIGILMIVLGVIAIFYPFFATIVTFNIIGFVLMLFGTLQLFYGFQTRNAKVGQFVLNILVGLFYLAVGFWILRHPVFAMVDLTLIVGILFFIEGTIQVINALEIHPSKNRIWMLVSGIISIILGILLWSNWPLDSLYMLGLLTGINLVTTGVGIMIVLRAAKKSIGAADDLNRIDET